MIGLYMDFYTMCRLFRSFRQVEKQHSADVKNAIIYVGNNHAKHYRKLFADLFNAAPIHEASSTYPFDDATGSQCLNLADFSDPPFQ